MKVTIEINDKIIDDLLQSGIDAGIRYWCSYYDRTGVSGTLRPARVRESETDRWYPLDIRRAIELCVNKYGRVLDPANLDAEVGNLFIQLAAFGEIKYG